MEMFEKTFAMFAPFARNPSPGQTGGQPKSAESKQGGGEMDDLRRQLSELQKRLDKLGGQ
jgi:polyhydroxyalkanoate synthesis regulator protein